MNVITLSDLRSSLPSLLKRVGDNFQRYVVTVSGKPKAVIMSLEEVESLEETADVLAHTNLKSLDKGITQAKEGLGTPLIDL